MNVFLGNLREIAALIIGHTWGTPAAWVSLAVAAVVLFFGAGTVARVIFGKDTGLIRTFVVAAIVLAAGVAGTAAAWTWASADLTLASGAGVLAALAAVWPASKILRVPFGPAFGILLFASAIGLGAAHGAGRVCRLLQDGARRIDTTPAPRSAE